MHFRSFIFLLLTLHLNCCLRCASLAQEPAERDSDSSVSTEARSSVSANAGVAGGNSLSNESQENDDTSESGLRPLQTNPDLAAQEQQDQSVNEELKRLIESRRAQVEGDVERTAETKEKLLGIYDQALVDLKTAAQEQKQKQENLLRVSNAPQRISKLKESQSAELEEDSFQEQIDELTFAEFEDLLAKLKSQLATQSVSRTTLDERIASRRIRRAELPKIISDSRKVLEETPTQVAEALDDPVLAEALKWALDAKRLALSQQVGLLESELLLIDAETALLPLQLDEAVNAVSSTQDQIEILESELGDQRRLRINDFRRRFEGTNAPDAPALNRIQGWLGIETAQEDPAKGVLNWRSLSAEIVQVGTELKALTKELEYWEGVGRDMKSRIEPSAEGFTRSNRWLVERLRRQRDELPKISDLQRSLSIYIQKMQRAQTLEYDLKETDRELRLLEQESNFEAEYLSLGSEIVREMKGQAIDHRKELEKLAEVNVDTTRFVRRYRKFIDKQLLWIPNAESLSLRNVSPGVAAFRWLIDLKNWKELGRQVLGDIAGNWAWYILFCSGYALLLTKQPSCRDKLILLSNKAARGTCVEFRLSVECLLLTLLIAIPIPLLLLFLNWRLNVCAAQFTADNPFSRALAGGLLISAATLFPMELLRQVCRPVGLGTHHFGWEEQVVRSLRLNLRWLLDFAVVLAGLVGMFVIQSDSSWEDSLGRLCFILLMPLLSVFFARTLSPNRGVFHNFLATHKDGWIDQLSVLWYPAAVMAPIVFAVLSGLGYHYTSQQLALRLIATLWVVVLFAVAYCLLKRWLVLNRRQIMLAQARQRLEEAAHAAHRNEKEKHPTLKGEEQLNLVAIDQQTKRLLASICVVGGLVFSYVVWADVLPAISQLDNVVLWNVTGDQPDSTVAITLASLVQVIPIVVLATVAARNLPGLLEIAFLQHLPLTNAARYAISTLASYAIAAIGIVFAATVLGLRWGNIQWVVAGLGVGLGFGMQEIFANFISGIILLFEQPIRVGDIVTIDDTTGTVSKIRIRATTIVNWDRQELIVPNKELITGKLINWTLSDETNRVVVNVGVAYGTDTEQACALLRSVCESNSYLMGDPGPMITFEGFGDNTLNLVLRAYLADLDNRLSTIHALHQQIYEAFSKAGIEISFPQRDLHVRSLPKALTTWLNSSGS